MGALSKNGWAIAQKTWPITTNANPTFTKQRIRHPNKVTEAPITTPFLIPLTSITQLDGKLMNI
jgi:hypothetical protein